MRHTAVELDVAGNGTVHGSGCFEDRQQAGSYCMMLWRIDVY